MGAAREAAEKAYGPGIEAKFELNDEHELALSIYPTAKGLNIVARSHHRANGWVLAARRSRRRGEGVTRRIRVLGHSHDPRNAVWL